MLIAVMAQSVERRLGKAEVGGSIPLGSFGKSEDKDFSRYYNTLEGLYFVVG